MIAPGLGLRILKPPFDIPRFVLDLVWHQGRDDAALQWLRALLIEVAAEVRAESTGA